MAFLYMALDCEHVNAASSRHGLTGIEEIVIGRADERCARRHSEGGVRRLSLCIASRWLSATHARITRVLGNWILEDAKSKNGTLINGAPVTRAALADGDVIEAGHVFFVFRNVERRPLANALPDVELTDLPAPASGLATLVPSLSDSFAQLVRLASSHVSVIVHGESGTGKELVARALHHLSGRSGHFIAVNSGALPATLVEGELFGHKKGAFSGAVEDRTGLVRAAHRGTLFLDEIGDLPLAAQAALLRVLQEGEVVAVGATQPVRVDVRVVSATHRDLDRLVAEGKFRADLLARLRGFTLALPPLRERREEMGMIAADLLRRLNPKRPLEIRLAPETGRALMLYNWPLNVRELQKCLGAATVLAGEDRIEAEHLPREVRRALEAGNFSPIEPEFLPEEQEPPRPARPLTATEESHRDELSACLREHRGNISAVARSLGKARVQIQRWIKRYRIDPFSFRD